MKILFVRVICVVLTSLIGIHLSINAQSSESATQKDSITVNLAIKQKEVPIGQSPWTILTVENLTDHPLAIYGDMYRVYVAHNNAEAPTTLTQRRLTGRLRSGESGLRSDEFDVWTIAEKQSGSLKFQLAFLYDLSAPGEYTTYIEVKDPSSKKWIRTNTVSFEMQAPSH